MGKENETHESFSFLLTNYLMIIDHRDPIVSSMAITFNREASFRPQGI